MYPWNKISLFQKTSNFFSIWVAFHLSPKYSNVSGFLIINAFGEPYIWSFWRHLKIYPECICFVIMLTFQTFSWSLYSEMREVLPRALMLQWALCHMIQTLLHWTLIPCLRGNLSVKNCTRLPGPRAVALTIDWPTASYRFSCSFSTPTTSLDSLKKNCTQLQVTDQK